MPRPSIGSTHPQPCRPQEAMLCSPSAPAPGVEQGQALVGRVRAASREQCPPFPAPCWLEDIYLPRAVPALPCAMLAGRQLSICIAQSGMLIFLPWGRCKELHFSIYGPNSRSRSHPHQPWEKPVRLSSFLTEVKFTEGHTPHFLHTCPALGSAVAQSQDGHSCSHLGDRHSELL